MITRPWNRSTFRREIRHNALNAFLILIILFTVSNTAGAEWYKDYETALDLIKKGRYSESIPRLQAAIAQKNQEGLNIKFYGMKFDDYLPHYYLGKAYFNEKNYQAAVREFEISSSQGEIQRERNLFQNLTELKTLASAQLRTKETPPPPVVAEKKPEPVQPQPEPVSTNPQPVIEKEPETKVAVRETPVESVPITKPEPSTPPVVPPQQSVEEANLERAKMILKNGAREYFQGDFDSAISSFLAALRLTPRDPSAQFLLGCSYAAKYLLSGSSDTQSLQKASSAFQKIRKTNPNHPLTRNPLISPAVREIYQKSSGA